VDYWQYHFQTDLEARDILIALLADAPFDTFEETETGLNAYIPAQEVLVKEADAHIQTLTEDYKFTYSKTFIPGQNWNEIWESNFPPVVVDDFCAVRADFHDPIEGVQYEMVITPKMAFGTGHHETTWMCMKALRHLPVAGASVLDYGCGTGVLAILAAKLGASRLEAVDIEEESYRSTIENSQRNGTPQIVARCGILSDVQGRDFDLILANINRNVILDSLPRLAELTTAYGLLLVSGILREDETTIIAAAQAVGFKPQWLEQRGNWLCIFFAKG
jgi:ribosomal protein L11 methyltransferase